ncbi:MAG: 3-isopropylmalate dehydratase small subunit [Candidatus Aminicenantes bacterium RBG_16_63_16]|nr:MAG: 3-isopropylmalate dehydratase small subunit [Candidatus Aminicenantes bacterium RBG_16_63_16]
MKGLVLKYGDHVDTDAIIPARYLNTSDPGELARHCMEDVDPEFPRRVKPGSILVAGENFGSGSSREHAPIALKASGIAGVVAASFARIFFRNAINIGLPILECREAAEKARDGDTFEVDFASGVVRDLTQAVAFQAEAFPQFVEEIIRAGGLVEAVRKKMKPPKNGRRRS